MHYPFEESSLYVEILKYPPPMACIGLGKSLECVGVVICQLQQHLGRTMIQCRL